MRERAILKAIRQAVNKDGRARVVRNTVGEDQLTHIRYGLGTGSADLVGVLRDGRALALEVKRPGEGLSRAQALWLDTFRRWGGVGATVTSPEEALAVVEEASSPLHCETCGAAVGHTHDPR